MTLRDDLIPTYNAARGIVDGLGLRQDSVIVRSFTDPAPDPDPLVTALTARVPHNLQITPRPRVHDNAFKIGSVFGEHETGDRMVDRISLTYTEAQLDPGEDAVWVINGDPYRLRALREHNSQWKARVRRMQVDK